MFLNRFIRAAATATIPSFSFWPRNTTWRTFARSTGKYQKSAVYLHFSQLIVYILKAGSADVRLADVRPESEKGAWHGATNPESTSAQRIRLPSGRRVSRVSYRKPKCKQVLLILSLTHVFKAISKLYDALSIDFDLLLQRSHGMHTAGGGGQLQDRSVQSFTQR